LIRSDQIRSEVLLGLPDYEITSVEEVAGERMSHQCPQILGIDEYFFTRRHGYATPSAI
jgi:hypothetical protein